jgi:hypothetical protein
MTVKVKGLDKALKDIQKKGDKAVLAVKKLMFDTASDIEFDAKTNAPEQIFDTRLDAFTKQGQLGIKGRIRNNPLDGGLRFEVGIPNPQDFDAYAEFGTGLSAKEILYGPGYTDEMRSIAREYFKNGEGTLRGEPFLFPAFIKHTANLVPKLEKEIEKAVG